MAEIRTILYPTDFSDNARLAEPFVVEIARRFEARVVVVHAMLPTAGAGWHFEPPHVTGDIQARAEEDARRRIDEVRERLAREVGGVETALHLGTPFVEIIQAARDHEAGMIILCTHGWSGLKHVLLGSTAERIVRKAPCPVLTVPNPGFEFEHP